MHATRFVATLGLFVAVAALARGTVPADVRAFIGNAERCQHVAGEWESGLGPARKREIERGVDQYCRAAQRQLKQVEAKYRHDAALRGLIAQHRYDAVVSYRK